VDFRNNVTFATQADRLVRDVDGSLLVGTNFFAQLYWDLNLSNVGNSDPFGTAVATSPARFRPTTTMSPGTWIGGNRTIGYPGGQSGTLQVRAWDSNFGLDFNEAVANGGKWGVSLGFEFTPLRPDEDPPFWFMENLRGFTLIPEPSSLVLLLLAACALWSQLRKP
jgi:hypothetical protein